MIGKKLNKIFYLGPNKNIIEIEMYLKNRYHTSHTIFLDLDNLYKKHKKFNANSTNQEEIDLSKFVEIENIEF